MSIEPEKSWHYDKLTRQGVPADEARKIVLGNQRRVATDAAIVRLIFNKELDALVKLRVGLPTNLFDPHVN